MKIIATINEVFTRNWKVNAGEYKAKRFTVETPKEFAECDAIMVSFNSKENGKFTAWVKNGKVDLPYFSKPGNVSVGVYAYTEKDGKLDLRYSPTPVVMPINPGSYIEGEKPPTPTPGTYAELLEMIKNSGGGSGSNVNIQNEVDVEGEVEYGENDVPSVNALLGVFGLIAENFASVEELNRSIARCDGNYKKADDRLTSHISNQSLINFEVDNSIVDLRNRVTALEGQSVVIDEISDLVGGAE